MLVLSLLWWECFSLLQLQVVGPGPPGHVLPPSLASSLPSRFKPRYPYTPTPCSYEALGAGRLGVCSTYLGERLAEGQELPVYIHKNPDFRCGLGRWSFILGRLVVHLERGPIVAGGAGVLLQEPRLQVRLCLSACHFVAALLLEEGREVPQEPRLQVRAAARGWMDLLHSEGSFCCLVS